MHQELRQLRILPTTLAGCISGGRWGLLTGREAIWLTIATLLTLLFYLTYPTDFKSLPLVAGELKHLSLSRMFLEPDPRHHAAFYDRYPDLMYRLTYLAYRLASPDDETALGVNATLCCLIPAGSYLLTRWLAGPLGGACAFLFTALSDVTAASCVRYELETLVSVCLPWFLTAWIASDNGRRLAPTLLTGTLAGLGLLSKHSFIALIGLPLLTSVAPVWSSLQRQRELTTLLLTLVIQGLAFSCWTINGSDASSWARLLLGELILAGWLSHLLNRRARGKASGTIDEREGALLATLAASVLAVSICGPFYASTLVGSAHPFLKHPMFFNYLSWDVRLRQTPLSISSFLTETVNSRTLTAGGEALLPLLPLGLCLSGRRFRIWCILAAQLALSLGFYMALGLDETRFMLTLVPLQAAVQASGLGLVSGVAAKTFTLGLALWLAISFAPDQWGTLRESKRLNEYGPEGSGSMRPAGRRGDLLTNLRRYVIHTVHQTRESRRLLSPQETSTAEIHRVTILARTPGQLNRTSQEFNIDMELWEHLLHQWKPKDAPNIFLEPALPTWPESVRYVATLSRDRAEELALILKAQRQYQVRLRPIEVVHDLHMPSRLTLYQVLTR